MIIRSASKPALFLLGDMYDSGTSDCVHPVSGIAILVVTNSVLLCPVVDFSDNHI